MTGSDHTSDRLDDLVAVSTAIARLFDSVPFGVLVSTEDGTIVFANDVVSATLAYSPGELIGLSISRVFGDAEARTEGDPWAGFWQSPESAARATRQMVPARRQDGVVVPVDVGIHGVTDGTTWLAVASVSDAIDRVSLQEHLAALSAERAGFQQLVIDIAEQIVSVKAAALDETIVDSLRRIGEALDLDRAIVWQKLPREGVARPTYHWQRTPSETVPSPVPLATIPFVMSRLEAGAAEWFSRIDEVPDPVDRETFRARGLRTAVWIPVPLPEAPEGTLCVLALSSTTREQELVPEILGRLRLVAAVIGQALARTATATRLGQALDEIRTLRGGTTSEHLERRPTPTRGARPLIAESAAMQQVLAQVERVAVTPATVLLIGETGTGKEVLAEAIHERSPRHQRRMVRVNCAAIPSALMESELFGREIGAFTGAVTRQIGRFEAANQSTLFLDEVGELPLDVQVKLLRAVQNRVIERLGSVRSIAVDLRIVAASNRDLDVAVRDGAFREDLFYRLNVFPITIPPLRERVEDIPGLVWSFIDEFSRLFGKTVDAVPKASMRALQDYSWPGNVRELRNVIERAVIVADGPLLEPALPPSPRAKPAHRTMTLANLEADHIREVLEIANWRIRGRGGAAERLGLKPTTLESRMIKLGIERPNARDKV
jgi:formate hydrogenlyase transcriptional activator